MQVIIPEKQLWYGGYSEVVDDQEVDVWKCVLVVSWWGYLLNQKYTRSMKENRRRNWTREANN
jgi:hypothetical protein